MTRRRKRAARRSVGAARTALVLPAFLLAVLLGGCFRPGGPPEPGPPDPGAPRAAACATIFSTNDTHGRLLPAEYPWSDGRLLGGSAALGGYLRETRASSGDCPVFVVSGGDVMQGTLISNLTSGESTIAVMNELGYDAVATGNHEFDWGVDVLRERVGQAAFPFLGANIFLKGTDRHPEWARPYAIVEKGGVRIGFVGMTTQSTPTTTRPANVAHLEFRSIAGALDRYIPEVRAQGVDFVVAVMHAGALCDERVCEGEATSELAAAHERFDYAVTGHTHSRVQTEIRAAPVVQSGANTTAFGFGRLERRPDGQVSATHVEIRDTYVDGVEADTVIARIVAGYRAVADQRAARVVATLARALDKPHRQGEYAVGRVIADAQRAATGAQVAIMNNGGIRRGLPAGPVTYGELFELQPFQNTLVVLQVSGRVLLAALEHSLVDDGRVDAHLSGLTVRYDPAAPSGSRVVESRLLDGTPIDAEQRYRLAVNDFMAAGGSGFDMLLDADAIEQTGIVDLDALVEYLAALPQPIDEPAEPRWVAIGSVSPEG